MKVKRIFKGLLPLLAVTVMVSGCTPKSECDIEESHVHKFTLNSYLGKVTSYIDHEYVKYGDFVWNKDYIPITKDDEGWYNAKKELFEINDENWPYLYNFMASKHDYLEFYYHYTTTSTTTDSDGNTHTSTDSHSGWTDDPTHRGVTGEVRLYHYRFYGYKIVQKDGRYVRKESGLVDDLRDICKQYPYFAVDCSKIVYTDYYYSDTSKLRYLRASDFNYFKGPDLSNRSYPSDNKTK